MIKFFKRFFLYCFVIMLFSCKDKLTGKQSYILQNSVDYIVNKKDLGISDCYLVDPYFKPFNISDFFDSPDQPFVDFFERRSVEKFIKIENTVNKQFENKYSENLERFSSCEKSKLIIRFSGFSENIIIGRLEQSNDYVSKSELTAKIDINKNETLYYIFELDKKGNVIHVLENAVSYW